MPILPSADVTIDDEAGAFAGGTGYAIVVSCVERNADTTPRVYSSTKALLAQHGYSQGADFTALFIEKTGLPVIFVGVPTVTAGAVVRTNLTRALGTSVVSVAAGASGILEEVDGVFTVTTGGTVGTNGIVATLSLDGGRTEKPLRLGTANSYVIPYVGVTLNFAAGTMLAGSRISFRTSAPMWNAAGLTAARAALAAQLKLARSMVLVGDMPNVALASSVVTEVNAYESLNDRFVFARVNVRDRLTVETSGGPALTFAEVGATGDTITRATGSWLTDGFAVGDTVTVTNSALNNVTGTISALTALVLTFGSTDLAAEGPVTTATVASTETFAKWVSLVDAEYATIDAQKRIDLGLGRLRKQSPITGWHFRRPVAWAAAIREYEHDVHIPSWRKADGPLDGWSNEDAAGNVVEFDERVDGGGLAGRFTCARTYSNGPRGAFIAMSLTRATEGSLLSRTHNLSVANVACSVVQAETENAIGQVLVLTSAGTATEASLGVIESRVNSALQIALLQQRSEGQRASKAVWRASRADILNIPGAELTGVLDLRLNGTLEKITTRVKIQTAGA